MMLMLGLFRCAEPCSLHIQEVGSLARLMDNLADSCGPMFHVIPT